MNCLLISKSLTDLEHQIVLILTDCGCEVNTLNDLDEVQEHIDSFNTRLIISLDPDDNILKLVEQIRETNSQPIVILGVFREQPAFDLDTLVTSAIDDVILPPLDDYKLASRLRFIVQRTFQRIERSKIEAALRDSEANARSILDTTVDGIVTIDESSKILSYNQAAEKIFGFSEEEVLGENLKILMPAPFHEEHEGYVRSYHETNHKKIIGLGREVRGRRKNGETFPMELAVSEIQHKKQCYTGIIRDISVRRELETRLLQSGEEERRRIGQDIHDGLGQMLTGVGLIAKTLARSLKTKNADEAEAVLELVELIKEADEQARLIARTLIPVELEDGGLKSATVRLSNNLQRLYGLHCSYEETGDIPEMPAAVKTHFFRIIQEALNNAARHSKATHVSIVIAGNPRKIRARIGDNGVGINFESMNGSGMGLRIMQHRANVIGATLDIRNGSENGTVVICTLPLAY